MMYDDYPQCEYCQGSHETEEHDETPEQAGISWRQFAPLYHGTRSTEIEGGVLDPSHTSSSTYNTQRMAGNYGRGVYATTAFEEAKIYAGNEGVIHEVEPHPEDHGDYDYQIDPMGGTSIHHTYGMNIRDAAELASYGDEGQSEGVSLIFPGRMISKRQFRIPEGEEPEWPWNR